MRNFVRFYACFSAFWKISVRDRLITPKIEENITKYNWILVKSRYILAFLVGG